MSAIVLGNNQEPAYTYQASCTECKWFDRKHLLAQSAFTSAQAHNDTRHSKDKTA